MSLKVSDTNINEVTNLRKKLAEKENLIESLSKNKNGSYVVKIFFNKNIC